MAMTDREYAKRIDEDFQFMVITEAKGNRAMYDLLRDRELDAERKRRQQEADAAKAAPAVLRNQDKEERTA